MSHETRRGEGGSHFMSVTYDMKIVHQSGDPIWLIARLCLLISKVKTLCPVSFFDARWSEPARKTAKSVAKAIGGYQYPWKEKLAKYNDELSKGVWGYWELGAWKPLGISARRHARLRNEVLAGQDWPYDPAKKEMRSKRKGHTVDRIAAEKRADIAELMKKMPDMLLDYRKRRWEKKMKEEDAKD